LESIKRGIPTFVNEVDYVFAVDGRFSLREGSDYSDDGSTEYLAKFPNVIFRRYMGMEHDKRNQYIEMAEKYNVDILLVLDSDEYIVDADWKKFKSNLEKIKSSNENIHGLKHYYNQNKDSTGYGRIWIRPSQIRYQKAHCILNVNGNIMRVPSTPKPIEGIAMATGDELRDDEYLKLTSEYQGRMLEYEKPYRREVWMNKLDKILKNEGI